MGFVTQQVEIKNLMFCKMDTFHNVHPCNINTMGKVTTAQPVSFFVLGRDGCKLESGEAPPAGASRKGAGDVKQPPDTYPIRKNGSPIGSRFVLDYS